MTHYTLVLDVKLGGTLYEDETVTVDTGSIEEALDLIKGMLHSVTYKVEDEVNHTLVVADTEGQAINKAYSMTGADSVNVLAVEEREYTVKQVEEK